MRNFSQRDYAHGAAMARKILGRGDDDGGTSPKKDEDLDRDGPEINDDGFYVDEDGNYVDADGQPSDEPVMAPVADDDDEDEEQAEDEEDEPRGRSVRSVVSRRVRR